jgi:hypothetical protein
MVRSTEQEAKTWFEGWKEQERMASLWPEKERIRLAEVRSVKLIRSSEADIIN